MITSLHLKIDAFYIICSASLAPETQTSGLLRKSHQSGIWQHNKILLPSLKSSKGVTWSPFWLQADGGFCSLQVNNMPMMALVNPVYDCLFRLAQPDSLRKEEEVSAIFL